MHLTKFHAYKVAKHVQNLNKLRLVEEDVVVEVEEQLQTCAEEIIGAYHDNDLLVVDGGIQEVITRVDADPLFLVSHLERVHHLVVALFQVLRHELLVGLQLPRDP